jgi:hypothetical protein
MGFNSAFKGLLVIPLCIILCVVRDTEHTDCVKGTEGKVGRVHTIEAYGGEWSTLCPSWNRGLGGQQSQSGHIGNENDYFSVAVLEPCIIQSLA